MRAAKALVRLRGCAGSSEPSLVAYAISTKISSAGSIYLQNEFPLEEFHSLIDNGNVIKMGYLAAGHSVKSLLFD